MIKRADQLYHENAPASSTALVQACLAKQHVTQGYRPLPLHPRYGSMRLLAFPKVKIAVESDEICECGDHTVRKLIQRRLSAD
jgi:hypothetical protein